MATRRDLEKAVGIGGTTAHRMEVEGRRSSVPVAQVMPKNREDEGEEEA